MIYRIDVRSLPLGRDADDVAGDPVGEALRHQIAEFAPEIGRIRTWRIFLIDTPALRLQVQEAALALLADGIVESAEFIEAGVEDRGQSRIEIHLKPGVMDPVAGSTEMALRDLGLPVAQVRTGRCYLIAGHVPQATLGVIASRILANGVIESTHFTAYIPDKFPAARPYQFKLIDVPLRGLADKGLVKLSRDAHLFLSLEEMKAIQNHYTNLDREPTDIELETLAQTWSEHCVHKTLKSAVDLEIKDERGNVLEVRHYDNLIKDTIFKSTMELMKTGDLCLSVFKDNAGVIRFDETHAVCFKVETHNHPSAIEPYGGAATGIGGVIRDILGTGLAAKPIANTDVFCVAFPDYGRAPAIQNLLKGVLHPKRVLQQIVAGVRDYGNRMGIPTVNGAVYFDNRYLANPLVFCGCAGLIPKDKIDKAARAGDAIVLVGGRTGRDGIHGATFSSAELTDTHADEFSHAVQIGNAITEKKVADVLLQARDRGLFSSITDCGAGGLSSAIGEMAADVGATVLLDQVLLKYDGLKYDEIWISEAQERMVLSVPPENVQQVLDLARSEDVEATVIGYFGAEGRELILNYQGRAVGRLSMEFLHDGLPMPTRKATIIKGARADSPGSSITNQKSKIENSEDFRNRLLAALAHPNIASKHWIIRQYDHEVQGGSVIKPLTGALQRGPSDAAVLRPKLDSWRGIALSCGLNPQIVDPYEMAVAAIDEAVRNAVCVGADPAKMAILDNFCWPSVSTDLEMGSLVAACQACHDVALAYQIPFISGKDSLNNQFTNQETGEVLKIPNTLLISAISVLDDVRRCVTMDFKLAGGGPVYLVSTDDPTDLRALAATHRALSRFIAGGHVAACHDLSDGGLAVAAAEMCIASGYGLGLDPEILAVHDPFIEIPGRYLIELRESAFEMAFQDNFAAHFPSTTRLTHLGFIQHSPRLLLLNRKMVENREKVAQIDVDDLASAWLGTLDW